jgi:LemA protein
MTALYILIGLTVLVGLYVIVTYNALVSLRVRVGEAWSDIEVQMKRRYNLIPNLVETVKGYAKHEAGTLEKVVQARSEAMANQGPPGEQARSENMLTGALKSLFALAESYPELKANENFLSLQNDLAEVDSSRATWWRAPSPSSRPSSSSSRRATRRPANRLRSVSTSGRRRLCQLVKT